MATKPTLDNARWATDETNNTAPSSGQRDTGWTPGQVAISDYFNVLALEAYKWFDYLDDGDLTGPHSIAGTTTLAQQLLLTGTITPAALASGSTHNYAPTDLATSTVLRLTPGGETSTLTGLTGGANGRIVILENLHATWRLILQDDSASSTAANRFSLPASRPVALYGEGSTAILRYDGTLSRWILIGGTAKPMKSIVIAGCAFQAPTETFDHSKGSKGEITHLAAGAGSYRAPINVPAGSLITGVSLDLFSGAGAGNRVYSLKRVELATGYTLTTVDSDTVDPGAGPDPDFARGMGSIEHVVADGYMYFLEAAFAESGDGIQAVTIDFWEP